MATKRVRDYKKEYQQDLKTGKSGPGSDQHGRQRARRMYDKAGIDCTGKDIDHIKPLSKGGTNSSNNLRLRSPSNNRSFDRNSNRSVRVNKPLKKT